MGERSELPTGAGGQGSPPGGPGASSGAATGPDQRLEFRLALAETSLTTGRSYYDEQSTDWRHIETKANGLVTVSGIFVAGAFAFVREMKSGMDGCEYVVLLVLTFLLLIGAIVCALRALHVRDVEVTPSGGLIQGLVDMLREDEALTREDMIALTEEQAKQWARVGDAVKKVNEIKAGWLRAGQWLMTVAAVSAAALTMARVFS